MTVGRKYFLSHGLGGSVAERIAEDSGYSRGVFYSNFDGVEDLFLAVVLGKRNGDRHPIAPFMRRRFLGQSD
jgi:AcrR family transcriptional regulator